jgi:hypothetical protein
MPKTMFKFLADRISKFFVDPLRLKVIEPFGEMRYKDKEWFAIVDGISPRNKIELSICANHYEDDLTQKVALIEKFIEDYDLIVLQLYSLVFENLKKIQLEKTEEEIEKMYFLSFVSLQEDNSWWLVMEPDYKVETIYNYFIRFTMIDRKIVWKNFD